MEKKFRLLLLTFSVFLFSFFLYRNYAVNIKNANAVPGQLNFGSTTTSQIQTIVQKTTYQDDLYFGTVGYKGTITRDGYLLVGTTVTPTPGFLINVNSRVKGNGVSIGTTDSKYSLDVHDIGNEPFTARFQGNVGIGIAIPTTYPVPLNVYDASSQNLVKMTSGANSAQLGVTAGTLTLDQALAASGAGPSYFGGNLGVGGANPPSARLEVKGGAGSILLNPENSANQPLLNQPWMRLGGGTSHALMINPGTGAEGLYLNWDSGAGAFFGNGAGAETMRVQANGNVGINNSNPAYKLDVNGTFATRGSSYTTFTDPTGNFYAPGRSTFGSAGLDGTMRVYWPSGGGGRNVMVLTNGTPVGAGVTKSSVFQFKDNNNTTQWEMGNDRNVNGTDDFYLYDSVDAADRFYIGNTGNVGIGNITPGYKLTVTGGAIGGTTAYTPNYTTWNLYGTGDGGAAIYNDNVGYKKLMIVGNNSNGGSREVGLWDNLTVNGNHSTTGTGYFGGNVGIGTTTMPFKLEVIGDIRANGGWLRNTGATGLYNDSYGMYFYPIDGNANYWGTRSNYGLKVANLAGTTMGYVYHDGTNFGLLGSAGGWAIQIPGGTNYVNAPTSIRSPIFYDYNNTGYYGDFSGLTNLYDIRVNDKMSYAVQSLGTGYIYSYITPTAVIRHNADAAPPGCGSFIETMAPGDYEGQVVTWINDSGPTYCVNNNWAFFIHEATGYSGAPFNFPDGVSHNLGSNVGNNTNVTLQFVYRAGRWRPLNWGAVSWGTQHILGNLYVEGGGTNPNYIMSTNYTFFQGKVGFGMNPPTYQVDVSGAIRASSEIISTNANQFRMVQGNYGAFLRNDGSNTYFLLTASGDQYGSWNTLRPWAVNNASGYVTFGNGHNDLAEKYLINGSVLRGSLVAISDGGTMTAQASDSTHNAVIGVVSTMPGAIMDADGGFVIGPPTKLKYTNEKAPVALQGTAPTLVSTLQGSIKIGDAITTSPLVGFGQKATKAGLTVGRSLEAFNPSSCTAASSLDAITWPTDDGKNSKHPCYQLPDGTYVGKIMIALGPTWYDPDLSLTSTGNLNIVETNGAYQVKNGGSLIDRIGAFAELVVAKVRAGFIEAKKIVVNGLDVYQELVNTKLELQNQDKRIQELEKTVQELRQQNSSLK